MHNTEIRNVIKEDLPDLIQLIQEFAAFDGSSQDLKIDQVRLERAYLAKEPQLYALVALVDGRRVGFLNYSFTFSSFELKYCLWVEDVYVKEDCRGLGLGKALFDMAQRIAKEKDCARLEWLVRKNNTSGIKFYNRLKAQVDPDTIYVKWSIS